MGQIALKIFLSCTKLGHEVTTNLGYIGEIMAWDEVKVKKIAQNLY